MGLEKFKNTDYIGLCHYRRYFDFSKTPFSLPSKTINGNTFSKLEFGIPQNIIEDLQNGKVILTRKKVQNYLYTQITVCGIIVKI